MFRIKMKGIIVNWLQSRPLPPLRLGSALSDL